MMMMTLVTLIDSDVYMKNILIGDARGATVIDFFTSDRTNKVIVDHHCFVYWRGCTGKAYLYLHTKVVKNTFLSTDLWTTFDSEFWELKFIS